MCATRRLVPVPKIRASFSAFSSDDELNGPFQDVKAFRALMNMKLGPTVAYQ